MRLAVSSCALIALSCGAVAQEAAPYLDDRSTPSAVIRSLYSAINRGEYARAYSYFAEPPAKDVAAYAEGYANTGQVEVLTGSPGEEGAAGSVYYELPVAIRATNAAGDQTVFAGCYTLRLSNPAIQDDSFVPMAIETGSLAKSDAAFEEAVPRQCGDGPELPPHDATLEKARAMHAAAAGPLCETSPDAMSEDDREPQVHSISFRYDYENDDDPEHVVRLVRFFCYRGAYNESHVYYLADEEGGVQQLQFARPELDIRYEDDDTEKPVESIRIDGYNARAELVNSDYDDQTLTISEFSKWRGLGDASSSARWQFRQGTFRLVHFEVDASYDGEIESETIVDYDTAP